MEPITAIGVATYVADKLAAKYIQKIPDLIFAKNRAKLSQKLTEIIYRTIREFEQKYPIDDVGDQYAFYKSQILVDSLLNYSCFGDSCKNLEAVFEHAEHVLRPTTEQLTAFMMIFHRNVKENTQLRELEIEEKYKEAIFQIADKVDSLLHGLKMSAAVTLGQTSSKYLNKVPYFNVEELIGREEYLEKIHHSLTTKTSLEQIIHGVPGVGKTSLLLAYVNSDNYTNEFDHIAWVTVTSSIKQSMVLQLSSSDLGFLYDSGNSMQWNFDMLIDRMRHLSGRNLLIIDNTNDPDEISALCEDLGTLRWKAVITTRAYVEYCNAIELEDLSLESAKILFYRFYRKERNDEDLSKLLALINCHALLTELLAKVGNRNPGLDIAKLYLTLREKSIRAPEFGLRIPIGKHAHPANASREQRLNEYLQAIFELEGLSDEEKTYLRYFALLPPTGIHVQKLFELSSIDKSREIFFLDTLNELIKRGWVQEKKGTAKCHFLIQTVVREKLKVTVRLCMPVISSVKYQLYVVPGDNPLKKVEYLEIGRSILKYLQEDDLELASLSNNISVVLRSLGDYESALDYCTRALNIRKKMAPSEHAWADLAQSYNNTGIVFREMRRLEESERAIRASIEIYSKSGEPSAELANALSNLGSTLHETGDLKGALVYELKAISILEDKCDALDAQLSWAYCTVAQTYRLLGDYGKALEFGLKDLAITQTVLEPDHPELAITYQNLGDLYKDLKRFDEALDFAKKAMAIRERIHDSPHVDLARSYNSIGCIFVAMNKLNQAREYQVRAAKTLEQLNPGDDHGLATVYSTLATICIGLKDLRSAKNYSRKAIEIVNKNLFSFKSSFVDSLNTIQKAIDEAHFALRKTNWKKHGFKL